MFLDAADPANLRASITALQTAYDTTFKNRLTAMRNAITAFSADSAAMIPYLDTLEAAPTDLDNMKTDINTVQTSMAPINWANPWAAGP